MRKLSYRQLISMAVILFMVLNGVLIFLVRMETEEEFHELGDELINQTTFALRYWIDDQIRFAQVLADREGKKAFAANPEREILRKKVENELIKLNEEYDFYDSIPITLIRDEPVEIQVEDQVRVIESGQVIIDTASVSNIGIAELDPEDIDRILNGAPYSISQVHKSALTDNLVFDISVPIKTEEQGIVGILTLSTKTEYFTKVFIDNKHIGETGYMFMLDDHARVIAHPNYDFILSDSPDLLNQATKLLNRIEIEQDPFVDNFLGARRFYYGKKVIVNMENSGSDYNYYIVITQDWEETLDEVFQIAIWFFILTLLTGILIIRVYVLMSEGERRKRHAIELMVMNQALEQKVDERTKALKELAVTDGLTGLYNHRHSLELLDRMISETRSSESTLTVLLADIDHFKQINDTYGHQVGDQVLKEVADIMKSMIRETDFAGRYGGEEFIVVLADCPKERGQLIAERIRQRIGETNYEDMTSQITISIGLASWAGESASQLIKEADERLYKAKHGGRNLVVSE